MQIDFLAAGLDRSSPATRKPTKPNNKEELVNISIFSVFVGQEINRKHPYAHDMWEIAVEASEGCNSEYFLSEADAWNAYETALAHPVVECNDAGNQVFSCRIIAEAIVTEERFNEAIAAGKSLQEIYDDCSHDGWDIESEMSAEPDDLITAK